VPVVPLAAAPQGLVDVARLAKGRVALYSYSIFDSIPKLQAWADTVFGGLFRTPRG
jgi:hypothetical protein